MELKVDILTAALTGISREELSIVSVADERFHSWHFINTFNRLISIQGYICRGVDCFYQRDVRQLTAEISSTLFMVISREEWDIFQQ